MSLAGQFDTLEPGVLPISAPLLDIEEAGTWRPFSATFHVGQPVTGYAWRALAAEFSESDLTGAMPVDDPTYYLLPEGLPEGLPERIRVLAGEITHGLASPYVKAKAIEEHLKTEYVYSLPAPGEQPVLAPAGRDPVDWFLNHGSGGSTSFSSAFVLLARAADVPARVVSGWAIAPVAGEQTMNGDHAHQWAEIALDGFGWISFDPTPGGAPSRVRPASSLEETASASRETAPEEKSLQKEPGTGDESVSDVRESEEERATLEGIALHNLAVALDPQVRKEAALLLGELGGGPALAGLAEAMFNDPIQFVRAAAIEGMALADYEQLVKILLEHEDALLRKAAATALGKKDDARALSPLGEALHTDADTGVRAAAAEALGVLGEEGAFELLARALFTDAEADEEVRAAAGHRPW